jgi:hypothetical protein
MNKRPLVVTVLSCLLVAAGAIGLVYHLSEFKSLHPFPYEILLVCLVRLLAIVSGVFMLRGDNWARWLAVAWIAFHVVVSFFHSLGEVVVHGVLLALFAYGLFRSDAAGYFSRKKSG